MAQGRFSVTAHSRSSGHSAAAALAYRGGLILQDIRTGEVHDYSSRDGRQVIVWSGLLGVGAGTVFGGDVQAFATAMELAETRKNSRIGRDIKFNLPHELGLEQRIELANTFSRDISARYHTPCHLTVHQADPQGDERNEHAHLYLPTRELLDNGRYGPKLRILDDQNGGDEIKKLRAMYESRTNMALQRAGYDVRIDVSKQPDKPQQPRLGATATALERKNAIRQGIDPRGIPMSDLVCRIQPVTKRGQALRDHEIAKRDDEIARQELNDDIEREARSSREQAGALYEAEATHPERHAARPAPPSRRRRMSREERQIQRQPRRAARGEERPRRPRRRHAAAPVTQARPVEVAQPAAQSRRPPVTATLPSVTATITPMPTPARQARRPTVAAVPTVTQAGPADVERPAMQSEANRGAGGVQSRLRRQGPGATERYRSVAGSRPRPSTVTATPLQSVTAITVAPPRAGTPRPSLGARTTDPAQSVTPMPAPARQARRPTVAAVPTVTQIGPADVERPAMQSRPSTVAATPLRSVTAITVEPPRPRPPRLAEADIPPSTAEIGRDLAHNVHVPNIHRPGGRFPPRQSDQAHWDWAHCYDHAPDEDRAIKTVLAEAHETDEREQSVPGQSRIVVTPDSVNLKKILKWIQTKLVKTVDSLRRIQQAEAKRKPPPVDRSHGCPPPVVRPTTTRWGEQRGTQEWER